MIRAILVILNSDYSCWRVCDMLLKSERNCSKTILAHSHFCGRLLIFTYVVCFKF